MNISVAIDIKKEKLAKEMSKVERNWNIINRLKNSIKRHQKEMLIKRHRIKTKKERRKS